MNHNIISQTIYYFMHVHLLLLLDINTHTRYNNNIIISCCRIRRFFWYYSIIWPVQLFMLLLHNMVLILLYGFSLCNRQNKSFFDFPFLSYDVVVVAIIEYTPHQYQQNLLRAISSNVLLGLFVYTHIKLLFLTGKILKKRPILKKKVAAQPPNGDVPFGISSHNEKNARQPPVGLDAVYVYNKSRPPSLQPNKQQCGNDLPVVVANE